jgi:RNA polymerase sigma-70 factor (ECF subfamily)
VSTEHTAARSLPHRLRAASQAPRNLNTEDSAEQDSAERVIRRLVARAKAGDDDAMRELYVRLAPGVHAYVARIVVDRDDADDVTQQVFAKLLTELWRYQPREAPFRAWLLRIARNVAIDHLRRVHAVPSEAVSATADRVDESGPERRASLREALSALTPGQRDVLVLRHLVGLTPEEIAVRLGRSVRAVHCLHHRGRAAACIALHELGSAPATGRPLLPPAWERPRELEAMSA